MWTLCFLASATYCCIEVVNVIKHYFKYPVLIDIQLIHESPTYFPAVTICNLNPFNSKRAQSFMQSVYDKYNFSLDTNISNIEMNAIEYTNARLDLFRLEVKYQNMNQQQLQQIGFKLDEMLISCTFNQIRCNSSNFSWLYSYEYGNCYTFNLGDNGMNLLEVHKGGIHNGLQLELYVADTDILNEFVYKTGIQLVVHNQSTLPDLDDGIYVSTGFETNLLVDRTFSFKLDSPYSTCTKIVNGKAEIISKLYDKAEKYFNLKEYNQKLCIKLCFQNNTEQRCKCSDASLPVVNGSLGICYTSVQIECLKDSKLDFYNQRVYDICEHDCPTECDSIKYTVISSSAVYPSQWYSSLLQTQYNFKQYLPNNTNYEYMKASTLKVNVFYDDLVFTISNEEPAVKIQDELASIGGQLGLFIGISFLSVVEVIEICLEVLFLILKHALDLKCTQNRVKNAW